MLVSLACVLIYWLVTLLTSSGHVVSDASALPTLGGSNATLAPEGLSRRAHATLDVVQMALKHQSNGTAYSAITTLTQDQERASVLTRVLISEVRRIGDSGATVELGHVERFNELAIGLTDPADRATCLAALADFRALCDTTESPTQTEILKLATDQLRLIREESIWERWKAPLTTAVIAALGFVATHLVGTFLSEVTKVAVESKATSSEEPK